MIDKCKKCDNPKLAVLKDFKYYFEGEYQKDISGFKCDDCGAIYSIVDEKLDFWEFPCGNYKESTNQVAGWATNENMAYEKS